MKVRRSLAATGTRWAPLWFQLWEFFAVMGASHRTVERSAAFANPADDLRGNSCHEGMGRYVLGDDGAGCDHRAASDCQSTEDRRVRADGSSVLDGRWDNLPVRTHRTRIQVVGEARVRANENTTADGYAAVERGEVLDLAVIGNHDLDVNIDILADAAVPPDVGPLADLGPVPDGSAVPDDGFRRDVGRRMNADGQDPALGNAAEL